MSFEQGHALVIGVGTYQHHPEHNVPITVKDAQAVQAALLDKARCGYPPEQVRLLHDDTATRQGILDELKRLAGVVKPENTVTVFYCGHGGYGTDGSYYLTTHDTRVENNGVKAKTGVSEAELMDALRKIQARRLLLIFNACHSGEVSPSLEAGSPQPFGGLGLPTPAAEALLSTGEGRIIIAACRPEQKSWIGPGPLTFFAQALVDGLSGKGGMIPNHGYISAYGLYEHIFYAIGAAVKPLGEVQEPELTVLKGVGPFPVALYKGASDLGTFDESESLPPGTAARQVEPAISQHRLEQYSRNVVATGGSTVVQGSNNKVVGAGGVMVGGNVGGSINTGTINGPQYNIKGGVHAGRDVVMGDQFNVLKDTPRNRDEYIVALIALQKQIAELKRGPDLRPVQERNIQGAEEKIAEAVSQAQGPEPLGERIRDTLNDAKDFMDAISGSMQSSVNLGMAIGTLALLAMKLFGG